MLCIECGSEMVKCTDSIKEVFRGEELTITGIEHYRCESCGEVLFTAEEGKKYDKAISEQYAMRTDLLSPNDIKEVRKKYNLSQQEFQQVLGVSSPSVSRWETGKAPQSKPVDLLIRAYKDSPLLAEERIKQLGISKSFQESNVIRINFSSSKPRSGYDLSQEWEAKEE